MPLCVQDSTDYRASIGCANGVERVKRTDMIKDDCLPQSSSSVLSPLEEEEKEVRKNPQKDKYPIFKTLNIHLFTLLID